LLAGSGCGSHLTEILLQCPSPDRTTVAIVWAQVTGLNRSIRDVVSVHAIPSTRPLSEELQADPSPVLVVNSAASAFALKWEGNDRLLVTVTYPDSASVSQIADQRTIRGHPVRVGYQEVKIDRPFMATKAVCESAALWVENPTPKRIK
jgi:hypothetical protein